MPKYKPKFRAQVAINTIEKGLSYPEASTEFGVSKELIGVWVRKLREEAHLIFEDQRAMNGRSRTEVIMETSRYKRKKQK